MNQTLDENSGFVSRNYGWVMVPVAALAMVATLPGRTHGLGMITERLLADEPRRAAMGAAARRLAQERYSWPDIARRLEAVYERVTPTRRTEAEAA